jgi:hypothetical protein
MQLYGTKGVEVMESVMAPPLLQNISCTRNQLQGGLAESAWAPGFRVPLAMIQRFSSQELGSPSRRSDKGSHMGANVPM